MITRVELRDKSFNILEILDNEFIKLTWDFNRIGGCGSFSFDLPRPYCNEKYISGDFNVRIYKRNPTTKAYDLWFQGLVEDKIPNIQSGVQESITVQGQGYQTQLGRIYVAQTFTSTEIGAIVKSILDNFIVPNTDITYSAGDIVNTGFTADNIALNTDGQSAIQNLADIAGNIEWGVDLNRHFYFKTASTTVGFRYALGGPLVTKYNSDDSFKDIINRVIVQGGDVSGSAYTKTFDDLISQRKYGRRDQVIQNTSITTDNVAQQFANSVFAQKDDVVRRATCEITNEETQAEASIPLGLFNMIARAAFYGENLYGTSLYSGQINFQINKITYTLDDQGGLVKAFDLGSFRPDIIENIGRIKYQIDQLRSAGV